MSTPVRSSTTNLVLTWILTGIFMVGLIASIHASEPWRYLAFGLVALSFSTVAIAAVRAFAR